MSLSRLSITLYAALIFCSGALVGVFGHRLYTVNAVDAKTTRNPDEWRKRYVTEMQTRLKLSSDQVQKLNRILDETRERFHAARERMRPEMDAIRRQQIAEIQGILDPAQRAEYDKMREERDQNMKKGSPGRGPGQGGPPPGP
jgi:DNA anti-recombination protein RmuC